MSGQYKVAWLCEALLVSRSGYYDWKERRRQPGPRQLENIRLRERIREEFARSRQTYGSPRLAHALGCPGRRNRIARLMRLERIFARQRSKYRVATTDSRHGGPIAPNRLHNLTVRRSNQVWVSDATAVLTAQGWLYLVAVLDLFTRRVVGWAMSQILDAALVISALSMAQARTAIFDYIETFYNRTRLHSSLDYQSPIKFESKSEPAPGTTLRGIWQPGSGELGPLDREQRFQQELPRRIYAEEVSSPNRQAFRGQLAVLCLQRVAFKRFKIRCYPKEDAAGASGAVLVLGEIAALVKVSLLLLAWGWGSVLRMAFLLLLAWARGWGSVLRMAFLLLLAWAWVRSRGSLKSGSHTVRALAG
jgi:hypothetical protein